MKCERCEEQATLHVTEACNHAVSAEAHLCEPCGRKYLSEVNTQTHDTRRSGPHNEHREYQIEVVRLIISELDDHQVIVFREVGGTRAFPLVCGIFEATIIDRKLKNLPSPRPLAHDGWFATLTALSAKLESVGIDALQDQIYFASLRLARRGSIEPIRVDIRPSDAVAMALIARVPIYISEQPLLEATE